MTTLKEIELKIDEMAEKSAMLHKQISDDLKNQQETTAHAKNAVSEAVKCVSDCQKLKSEAENILLEIRQKGIGVHVENSEDEAKSGNFIKSMCEQIQSKGVNNGYQFEKKENLTMTNNAGWWQPQTLEPLFKIPEPKFGLLDLIPIITVDGTEVNINKETGFINNAAFIAEGMEKPESEYTTTNQVVSLNALAHIFPLTQKLLKNGKDELVQELIDKLIFGMRQKLEQEIISGDGTVDNSTGVMHLAGLLANATEFNNPNPDAINRYGSIGKLLVGALQVQMTGYIPDALVINPADWTAIQLEKDDVGRYLVGNPLGNTEQALWGLPVVTSLGIPINQWLIGDFARNVRLYRNIDGVEIKILTEHKDWAARNLVGIRAEEYLGLGIINQAALVKGDYSGLND